MNNDATYLIVLKSGGVYKFLVKGINMVEALDVFLKYLSNDGKDIGRTLIDEIRITPVRLEDEGVMQI